MLQCRFFAGKHIQIAYNLNETFEKNPSGQSRLQVTLIESGSVALYVNHSYCFLQEGALIFSGPSSQFEKMYSRHLVAKSIVFEPDFIHFECMACRDGKDGCETYHHPFYHLFYVGGRSYKGIMPLDAVIRPKVQELFENTLSEMRLQSDNHWCSRARINMQELFKLSEKEYFRIYGKQPLSTPLAYKVLEYIHANYEKEITVQALCELFHTNHTTLLKEFRQLTDTTIGQYILEYRLELVKEALLYTALTLDEVAVRYGFRQASYLSRVFRTRVGVAPGQFRNSQNLALRSKSCLVVNGASDGDGSPSRDEWEDDAAYAASAMDGDSAAK